MSKTNNKIHVWHQTDVKVKYFFIAGEKCVRRHVCPIYINLTFSYERLYSHQIWFSLDQHKQSYGGGGIPPSQVENVLNQTGKGETFIFLTV